MRLIKRLEIENFRSIRRARLLVPGSYTPIVGVNNSGKSNILRALNLLFNGETEPDTQFDLRDDFHEPSPEKKKKEVSVTVRFVLPDGFNIPTKIREAVEGVLGRSFAIRKTWSLRAAGARTPGAPVYQFERAERAGFRTADEDATLRIDQFLSLIHFRYQPNHIHPSEALRREQPAIHRELMKQFRKSRKQREARKANGDTVDPEQELLKGISDVASVALRPIVQGLMQHVTDIERVEFTAPESLAEFAFTLLPRMKVKGGATLRALMHGSGVQNFLTLLVLRYLDSRYAMSFGWHQATIWGLEEPESFLHVQLEQAVASLLAATAEAEGGRFQIFCTTHSPLFMSQSESSILCTIGQGKTGAEVVPRKTLLGEAARRGVCLFMHPLFPGAPKPILICEGPSDVILLKYAYRALQRPCPWDIRDIAALGAQMGSGGTGLESFLRLTQKILCARPLDAPVGVLLDWGMRDSDCQKLRSIIAPHETSFVMKWDQQKPNEQLDRTFTGIERFLSTEAIREAERKGLLELRRPSKSDYPLSVVRESLNRNKVAVAELVVCRNVPADVLLFEDQLRELDKALADAQAKAAVFGAQGLFPNHEAKDQSEPNREPKI